MSRRMAGMSPEAEAQFLKGIAYIAERSPSAAERIVAKTRSLRERLADFPDSGVRGQIPGTRRMVLKPFVLTVRSGKNGIEIVAVRPGSRKDAHAPSKLLEDDEDEVEIPQAPRG